MSDLRPIETLYKGRRFRSRLEARWAVCFDALGIPWEYEAQGYQVDGGAYLPDFLLWGTLQAEVKPEVARSEGEYAAINKLIQFVRSTGAPLLLLDGMPAVAWYPIENSNGAGWVDLAASAAAGGPVVDYEPGEPHYLDLHNGGLSMRRAAEMAYSARFEHGESGGLEPREDRTRIVFRQQLEKRAAEREKLRQELGWP